jgi:hypothetical protein
MEMFHGNYGDRMDVLHGRIRINDHVIPGWPLGRDNPHGHTDKHAHTHTSVYIYKAYRLTYNDIY